MSERKEIEIEELSWMGSRWLLVNWLGWVGGNQKKQLLLENDHKFTINFLIKILF